MTDITITYLPRPYTLKDGTRITPGFVDRSAFPEIPDDAFFQAVPVPVSPELRAAILDLIDSRLNGAEATKADLDAMRRSAPPTPYTAEEFCSTSRATLDLQRVRATIADRDEVIAEALRLCVLIKAAEWEGVTDGTPDAQGCPWCGMGKNREPGIVGGGHRYDCPAFTSSGEVR